MIKKIMVFLISLLLMLSSTLSNAHTIGAWNVSGNPTAVGASMLFNASKGNVTSSVLITPNASQVAKVLRGGVAGYALRLAVEQLLGVVDWVLDPENNRVKYHTTKCLPENSCPSSQYYWATSVYHHNEGVFYQVLAYKPDDAASQICSLLKKVGLTYLTGTYVRYEVTLNGNVEAYCLKTNGQTDLRTVAGHINPNYDPTKEKTLPLETVAAQVIENAESDNLDAQFAVAAAANNILSEAEQDAAKAKPIEEELERNANNDICYKEWSEETANCAVWINRGPLDDPNRWVRACRERASYRLRLCHRNGGQPDPDAPPEWSPKDL